MQQRHFDREVKRNYQLPICEENPCWLEITELHMDNFDQASNCSKANVN
jgi:hypothetical protein